MPAPRARLQPGHDLAVPGMSVKWAGGVRLDSQAGRHRGPPGARLDKSEDGGKVLERDQSGDRRQACGWSVKKLLAVDRGASAARSVSCMER